MGARQSRRSVDITTTPKKGDEAVAVEGEGKLEKIAESDIKVTTNGSLHNANSEIEYADKDDSTTKDTSSDTKQEDGVENSETTKQPENVEETAVSQIKENGLPDEVKDDQSSEQKNAEDTTSGVDSKEAGDSAKTKEAPAAEETKKSKSKEKKKWSFRSISFSKKDKSKPNKDAAKKSEDVKEVVEENTTDKEAPVQSPVAKSEEEKVESPAAATILPPQEPEAVKVEATDETKAAAELVVEKESVEEIAATATPVVEVESKEVEDKVVEQTIAAPEQQEPVVEEQPPNKTEETAKVQEEPEQQRQTAEAEIVISTTATNDDAQEEEDNKPEQPEVRSHEEVPPPLPSSYPPSPVTVFAESTKADVLATTNIIAESSLSPTTTTNKEEIEAVECEVAVQNKESTKADVEPPATDKEEDIEAVQTITNIVEPSLSPTLDKQEEIEAVQREDVVHNEDSNKVDAPITIDKVENVVVQSVELEQNEESPKEDDALATTNIVVETSLPPPTESEGIETVQSEESVHSNEQKIVEEIPVVQVVEPKLTENLELVQQTIEDAATEVDDDSKIEPTTPPPTPAAVSESQNQIPDCSNELTNLSIEIIHESNKEDLPESSIDTNQVAITKSELIEDPVSEQESTEPLPEPTSVASEVLSSEPVAPVINRADSIPDISTESLPSLPEPVSESLPEPMSLPPVEIAPEPLVVSNSSSKAEETSEPQPHDDDNNSSRPIIRDEDEINSNNVPILTNVNANTNGLESTVEEKLEIQPVKQIAVQEVKDESGDKPSTNTESSAVEGTHPASVEE